MKNFLTIIFLLGGITASLFTLNHQYDSYIEDVAMREEYNQSYTQIYNEKVLGKTSEMDAGAVDSEIEAVPGAFKPTTKYVGWYESMLKRYELEKNSVVKFPESWTLIEDEETLSSYGAYTSVIGKQNDLNYFIGVDKSDRSVERNVVCSNIDLESKTLDAYGQSYDFILISSRDLPYYLYKVEENESRVKFRLCDQNGLATGKLGLVEVILPIDYSQNTLDQVLNILSSMSPL